MAGAGNIPTGNGTSDTHNHFIVTPEVLAKRYEKVLANPEENALRGDLTAMLTYTKSIYSKLNHNQDLLGEFTQRIEALIPNIARSDVNQQMLESDGKKFNFIPGGKLVSNGLNANVKNELYRFPSIFLMDLSILLDVEAETFWDALELLIEQGSVSKDLGDTLKFSLAAAVYIRLSAYFFYDSHDDRVSVAQQMLQVKPLASRKGFRWFVPNGLYSNMMVKLIPMKVKLKSDKLTADSLAAISSDAMSDWSMVISHYYSGRYFQTLSTLKQIFGENCVRTQCQRSKP